MESEFVLLSDLVPVLQFLAVVLHRLEIKAMLLTGPGARKKASDELLEGLNDFMSACPGRGRLLWELKCRVEECGKTTKEERP